MIGFLRTLRRLVPTKASGPLVVELTDYGVQIRPYRGRQGSAIAMTWGAIYQEGVRRHVLEAERAKQLARPTRTVWHRGGRR